MAVKDKTLVCRHCGREFTFTVGEQEFYSFRGLLNEPRHCPECRAARRKRGGSYGDSRQVYRAICVACGAETTVPFEPKLGRPVYCSKCYAKIRGSTLFRKARLSSGPYLICTKYSLCSLGQPDRSNKVFNA
ncbi:MAG: zinc-ribbon domain containing protein [Dehalococcoidia bacterium]|nr:zinc-ribbon domain containing protein [Dehalococcoidia bacterium]